MTRKPAPKPDDPEQSKRFIEIAKEVGADDADALGRTFSEIVKSPKNPAHRKTTKTSSDQSGQ
jgi:hypothetical protein